jgi:alpha-tubulin suppressor-like RCC1 family protein
MDEQTALTSFANRYLMPNGEILDRGVQLWQIASDLTPAPTPGPPVPVLSDFSALLNAKLVAVEGKINNIIVTAGGSNYSSTPVVTISAPPAGGVQATATATVVGGIITAITIFNPGSGYVIDPNRNSFNPYPTVTITDSSGSGATAISYIVEPMAFNEGACTGYFTSFVITRDKILKVWGSSSNGFHGTSTTDSRSLNPTACAFDAGGETTYPIPVFITSAAYESFILDSSGQVWVAGYNTYYDLGLNDTTHRYIFTKIPQSRFGNLPVVKIKTSGGTNPTATWAWNSTGKLYRWGYNNSGCLGTGDTTTVQFPTELTSPANIVDMSCSGYACGTGSVFLLDSSGSLWAAGGNTNGEHSQGNTTAHPTFVQVKTDTNTYLSNIVQIKVGGGGQGGAYYSVLYALDTNGDLWAAGYNGSSSLGNGNQTNTGNGYIDRVKTDSTHNIANVSKFWTLRNTHVCHAFALCTNGKLYGWGYNPYGGLGLGDTSDRAYATENTGIATARGTATILNMQLGGTGSYHNSYCLLSDGRMYGCGYNASYNLTCGDSVNRVDWAYIPCPSRSIKRFLTDTTGSENNLLVMTSDGRLYTGGPYSGGKLGVCNDSYHRGVLSEVVF